MTRKYRKGSDIIASKSIIVGSIKFKGKNKLFEDYLISYMEKKMKKEKKHQEQLVLNAK